MLETLMRTASPEVVRWKHSQDNTRSGDSTRYAGGLSCCVLGTAGHLRCQVQRRRRGFKSRGDSASLAALSTTTGSSDPVMDPQLLSTFDLPDLEVITEDHDEPGGLDTSDALDEERKRQYCQDLHDLLSQMDAGLLFVVQNGLFECFTIGVVDLSWLRWSVWCRMM